jgi:TetR/AcrR family transcriptional regulator, regulator of cefoperazone and chloramphenicol sensitivity
MDEPRQTNGAATREKLIEAAGETFAEKGLHGALIRDITQRAGANIAAVNYHFHDKDGLYAAVLRRAYEGYLGAVGHPLTAESPEGRIRQILVAIMRSRRMRPEWETRLLGRELFQPTAAAEQMQDLLHPAVQRFAAAVREIRPDLDEQAVMLAVAGIVARLLFHTHHEHMTRRMFPDVPQPSFEMLVDHIVGFSLAALHGLAAQPAETGPGRRPSAGAAGQRGAAASKRKMAANSD